MSMTTVTVRRARRAAFGDGTRVRTVWVDEGGRLVPVVEYTDGASDAEVLAEVEAAQGRTS